MRTKPTRRPTEQRLRDRPVEITPAIPGDRQVIASYGPQLFRISGQIHTSSVIVFTDHTIAWPVTSIDAVTAESFAAIREAVPPVEVLLFGVGPRNLPVSSTLRRELREAGIVLDAMDTGAACRTYNVLMAEDRRVAAALIALS